ncbi:MAG: HDOD domain-containing protein, partial [Deltaproteobacteria bacterium]
MGGGQGSGPCARRPRGTLCRRAGRSDPRRAQGGPRPPPARPRRGRVLTENEDIRRRVERLRELPTVPVIVQRVVEALDRPEGGHADAAALIETDQVLTAHLLRVANSAFYGLSGTIASVGQALTVLGTTVARSLVYSTAVLDLHIDLRGFWEHSVGTAVAAGTLARHLGLPRPEEVSGAGLLHDLGKVVLYRQAPEAFAA